MTGRTTWWACDAAEHDRELVVELGEEHGPAGPYVLRVLKDLAQQQRHEGAVKTGFRSLSRKTFIDPATVRAIIEHAAEIGALDELAIDGDGRRFTCRVSGWTGDQERGHAAFRKQAQRDRAREVIFERDGHTCQMCGSTEDLVVDHIMPKALGGSNDDENLQTLCGSCNRKKGATPPDDDTPPPFVTPSHGRSRSVTPGPPTRPDQTKEEETAEVADPARLDEARDRLRSEQVNEVFAAWVSATSRDAARTKLTPDRRRRIEKALTSHGLSDCLAAVRNIGADAWAGGENDRGRPFNDIEHALGSAKRIEDWRDRRPRTAKGGVAPVVVEGDRLIAEALARKAS